MTAIAVLILSMAAGRASAAPAPHELEYVNGQTLQGRVVAETPEFLRIELTDGRQVEIPRRLVREVREVAPPQPAGAPARTSNWPQDRSGGHYFLGRSALTMETGEVSLIQGAAITSVEVAVTNGFSIQAGTVVPLWFDGLAGTNAGMGLKLGHALTPLLRVGGSVDALFLPPGLSGFGLHSAINMGLAVQGHVTLGDEDMHVTASAGIPMLLLVASGSGGPVGVSGNLSGYWRVHSHFALMTEHWSLARWTAHGIGGRVLFDRLTIDAGAVWLGTRNADWKLDPLPLPWLGLSWTFGG